MRIQHNIMAMNAYNQYNKNTKALSANLEKLSSGYRINRAGDDAAGLAISEKMRAQITGLDAAQKNVKDGISLVKTAEGAMQEIHDMLNKMTYLATQSANGTYQDEVDRENLQKEVESLKSEINRIADSSNFNGIKLLDGSLDANGTPTTTSGTGRAIQTVWNGTGDPSSVTGTQTILDGDEATDEKKTVFEMDFSDLKAVSNGAGGYTAGTPTAGTPITGFNNTVTYGSTALNSGQIGAITGTLTVGGASIDLATIAAGFTAGTTTGDDAIAAFQTALDTAIAAENSSNAAANATYTEISNAVISADATNGGLTVSFDETVQTYSPTGGTITVTTQIDGQTLGSGSITVNANDDAEAIAQKVLDDIAGSASATSVTGVDVFNNGDTYKIEIDGSKLKFTLESAVSQSNASGNHTWDVSITGGKFSGNHTAGTNPVTAGVMESPGQRANTVLTMSSADMKDGTVINLDGKKVTLSVGPNSTVKSGPGVVKLTQDEADNQLDIALTKIAEALGNETDNFEVSVNNASAGGAADVSKGLAIYRKADSSKRYTSVEDLENVFSISTRGAASGKALTLQIGDTADDYNRMSVSVGDMHTKALGIEDINIGTQDGAAAAIQTIKDAINQVSSVRGDLGAIQNRLDHTGNNLAVMEENIQDAESTIRDTDVAEEMMSYVKNNILVQSAQAMLAQANQVPQGVLQLLG